jgi:hypothetical protein
MFVNRSETWWEARMEGSVLSFLKAEWKVSDTDSAHWASSLGSYANTGSVFYVPILILAVFSMFLC